MFGLMLAFWAAVIYIGIRIFRALTPQPEGRDAGRILEDRFARGEIDAEEFERRRRTLLSEVQDTGAGT